MATYRPVDTRIWSDRKFLALSDDGRMLWLFLLTTSFHKAIPGVIIAGEAALSEELGWKVERFRKGFAELVTYGLGVVREGRLIWLRNALKYQRIAGPNSIKGMAKIWDDIPETMLKHEVWQALKVACKSWDKLFAKGFPEPVLEPSPNGFTQDQEQKQEQKQDQEQEQEGATTRAAVPGHRETVDLFFKRFEAAYGAKPLWGGKQGGQIKALLKAAGAAEVQRRIAILFDSPPSWLKPPFDLGTLVQHFDKLVMAPVSAHSTGRVEPRAPGDYPEGEVAL